MTLLLVTSPQLSMREWHMAMIIRLLVRLVVLAVIIGLVAKIVPGIHTQGSVVWLKLGLFLLVVNAALLGITAVRKRRKHRRGASAPAPTA